MLNYIRKIICRLFAVLGLLAFLVVGGIAGLIYLVSSQHKVAPAPDKIILVANFNHDLVEQADDGSLSLGGFINSMTEEQPVSVHNIVTALERGAADPRVLGIVGVFGKNLPAMAHGQEIRAALKKFHDAGKFSYAFSTSYGEFGPANNALYLASAFDNVWVQPVGTVGLSGMRLEHPFARAALDKIGVAPRFIQREEYKTALQALTEDKMPEPAREMMQSILDDMNAQLVEGVAASRKLTPETVRALMAGGPYTAKEALAGKLIDRIGYSDEIDTELEKAHGKDAKMMRADEYARMPAHKEPKAARATVALITAQGEIGDEGKHFSPLSGGVTIDAGEISEAFEDAAKDGDVKEIIFRIDSPGGAPAASETIRRAVTQAQAKGKKVVVSMGAVAGSGGYWIAMNADRIFADPATLTGSIGVIGGKFVFAGLFDKLGITWDVMQTPGNNGMWSVVQD